MRGEMRISADDANEGPGGAGDVGAPFGGGAGTGWASLTGGEEANGEIGICIGGADGGPGAGGAGAGWG